MENKKSLSQAHYFWCLVIVPFVLLCLTVLFYYPSLRFPFQFDDIPIITKYFNIRSAKFTDLFMANRRWISYWFNTLYYSAAQFEPFLYRVGNLFFHCVTGLLIFFTFFCALAGLRKESFFKNNACLIASCTAGLFLLHPVQTQTVSYVVQAQLEGLMTCAVMGAVALFLWLVYVKNKFVKTVILLLLFVWTFLACCTKEIFIIAPILVILFDWFFIAQGEWQNFKTRILLHISLLVLVGSVFVYFADVGLFKKLLGFSFELPSNSGNLLTESYDQKITVWCYFISQFKVMLHYVWMFFWPFGICADYDWKCATSFFSLQVLGPLSVLIMSSVILLQRFIKNKSDLLVFGFLWFFVAILPRSTIVPSFELVNDYKTYCASIGIFFLLACLLVWVIREQQKTIQLSCMFLFFISCGFLTLQRNKVWCSEVDFWQDVVKKAPGKARGNSAYGMALAKKGQFKKAIYYYKKALQCDPYYSAAYNNMAIAYHTIGDLDSAIKTMEILVKAQPNNAEALSNMGSFLIVAQRYDQAEIYLKRAVKIIPHYGKAWWHMGRMYFEMGRQNDSYDCFKAACTQADYDTAQGFYSFGKSCVLSRKYKEALSAYNRSYKINPDSLDVCNELACACLVTGDYKRAQKLYEKVYVSQPRNKQLLFNLGESYWEDRDHATALQWYRKAEQAGSVNRALPIRIAVCLAQTGDKEKARVVLEKFILTNPPIDLYMATQNLLGQIS